MIFPYLLFGRRRLFVLQISLIHPFHLLHQLCSSSICLFFSSRLLIRYTAQGKKIEMRRVEKYQQELSLPQTQTSQAKGRIGIPKHSGLDENHFHPLTFLAVLGSACFGTGPKNCSASTTAAPAASFPFRRTSNLSVGERVLPPHPLSHPPNPCYRYRRNGKIPRHPTPAGRQSARAEQKKIGGTCTGT